MRFHNHHKSAARIETVPFQGLGFAMGDVQVVAQTMKPIRTVLVHNRSFLPVIPTIVAQPSGYSLLVALGREIRGR
jgi:hypothetical protein